MKVEVNVPRTWAYVVLIGLLLGSGMFAFVMAYNTGSAYTGREVSSTTTAGEGFKTATQSVNFGHTADELNIVYGGKVVTVQEAINAIVAGGTQSPPGTPTTTSGDEAEKYYIETPKNNLRNSVSLDMAKVNAMCKDREGCKITMGMKDWSTNYPGLSASVGPDAFFISETSNWWRYAYGAAAVSSDRQGMDNNNIREDVVEGYFDDCFLSDVSFSSGTANTDNEAGFHLLDWDGKYTSTNKICFLIIED